MSAYIQPLLEALQFLANPNDAVPMKKYMKNHFEFWGIKKPELTTILKEFLKQYGLPPTEDVRSVVYSLWQQPQRECQYVGMEIYAKFALKNVPNYLDTAEMMITRRSWWDTVDFIATNIVGKHLQKYYTDAEIDELTRYWIKRDNLWLRRTALLHQLKWKKTRMNKDFLSISPFAKTKKTFLFAKP
jgi:3-methyladenine DNA glycosylase AlkD